MAAVLLVGLLPAGALAGVRSCTASITPNSVQPGAESIFTVDVSSDTGPTIVWISIERPSDNFTVDAIGASGWQAQLDENGAVLSDGSLPRNETFEFGLAARTGLFTAPSADWTVMVSDSSDGSAATMCTGTLGTAIEGHLPPENEGQRISNVTSQAQATTAVIRWYSEVPTTSAVLYGTTGDYGQVSAYDQEMVTSHRVTIGGLTPATTYHFQVAGMDESGNPSYSGDNTFTTTTPPPVIDIGGGSSGGGSSGGNTTPTDKTPPTISLTTKPVGAVKVAPTFRGTARDNVGVAKVEYSVDGGRSWLATSEVTPVTSGKGKKKTATGEVVFSFTPVALEDGNFDVMARATDAAGNIGVTVPVVLVIDKLPPQLGSGLMTIGAQVLDLDSTGRWPAITGVDQTLTVNAVGGPATVTVEASKMGAERVSRVVNLRRDMGTGLWRGKISFVMAGTYKLVATAVDGAGNVTKVTLPSVVAQAPARVVAQDNAAIRDARVTVYYRNERLGQWVEWDGSVFGQDNPVAAGADGGVRLWVPAGTYYLRAEATGYQSLVTQTFTVDRPTPLGATLKLAKAPELRIGSWHWVLPWPVFGRTPIVPAQDTAARGESEPGAVGTSLPLVDLPNTDGGRTTTVGLLGKPTIVTVLSSWSTETNEQLPALMALVAKKGVNVVPMALGERTSRVGAFVERAGAGDLVVTADEAASLSAALGVTAVPTHYILDRKGVVQQVLYGVQSTDALAEALDQI